MIIFLQFLQDVPDLNKMMVILSNYILNFEPDFPKLTIFVFRR